MKVYLIILLGFMVSCSRISQRTPASIILDDNDIEMRENHLSQKFKNDPDYFFVNQETKLEIYALLKKLKFRAQFEIFEEAFDRGMFRTEILENLMNLTREKDIELVKKYSEIIFSLDDKSMDKALRILISDDISEAGDKLRDSYFNALKNGYFKHTDLAYFILSKKKGLTTEITDLVNYILSPTYFEINEDFLDLAYIELGKGIDVDQSHYVIFLLDQRRNSIVSKDLISLNAFVKSKQSLEIIFSYFNFIKRFDLVVSKELVKNIAGLDIKESQFVMNLVFNYFSTFKSSTDNQDFFKKVSSELNFIIDRLNNENVDGQTYRTLNLLFEKSGNSARAINRELVDMVFLAKNDKQRELVFEFIKESSLEEDIDDEIKRIKQVILQVKDRFGLGLAKRYIKNQGVTIDDLKDERIENIKQRASALGISEETVLESRLGAMSFLDKVEQDTKVIQDSHRKKLLSPYFALYHNASGSEKMALEEIISTIVRLPSYKLEGSVFHNVDEVKSLLKNGLGNYAKELGSKLFYGTFILNPSIDELKKMVSALGSKDKRPETKAQLQKIIQEGIILEGGENVDILESARSEKTDDYIDKLYNRNMIDSKTKEVVNEYDLYAKVIDQLRYAQEDLALDIMDEIGGMESKRLEVFVKLIDSHAPLMETLELVKGLNQKKLNYFLNVQEYISFMDEKLPYGVNFGDDQVMEFRSLILLRYKISLKAKEMRLLFEMLKNKRKLTPLQKKNSFIKNCAQAIRALFQ